MRTAKVTILVVDDEAPVREVVTDILQQAGFGILQASSGKSALSILSDAPRVDLLFTDIRMPGMDGVELAEAAQRLRPGLRVLFTTGYTLRHPGLGAKVLMKPYRSSQLLAAVTDLLGTGPG